MLREIFLLLVGAFAALLLRLATLGYSGASFFGLALFFGLPILVGSVFVSIILVGRLVRSTTRKE
jgi:hypothetical protein